MLTDILTVAWKELHEILFPDGRFQGGARNVFIIIGIAGLLFPLQSGPSWFDSWLTVYSACFPVILVLNYTADAFAGERERHTLETLLASRLPDSAVLFGKVLAIVAYGWGLVLACQPIAVIALNIVYRGNGLLFFRPAILAAVVSMGLVVALLMVMTGVLVSMNAPTVRAAGQRMLVPFVATVALPMVLPFVAGQLGWQPRVETITPERVTIAIGAVALVVTIILGTVALRRFRRERLVLA